VGISADEHRDLERVAFLKAAKVVEAQGAALAAQGAAVAAIGAALEEFVKLGRIAGIRCSDAAAESLAPALVAERLQRQAAAEELAALLQDISYQRLAQFDRELEAGRKWESERGLREHEVKMRDWQVEAEEARRMAAEAPPRDEFGWPILDGKPVAPGRR
jgi:hypothetical protein